MEAFAAGVALVLRPDVLATIVLTAVYGLFVGAMPGLTATMATALLVPFTFFMDPVPAIAAIVTATAMAIFSGDIPAALLRIPGTPASAAYVDEAYLMTRRGEANMALGINLTCSAIGGIFGTLALILAAPALAEVALSFSTFEYFWLACLGMTCAILIATDRPLKGMVALAIGLLVASIGLNNPAAFPRFTFGSVELLSGISGERLIPAMVGMFAIPEIIRDVTQRWAAPPDARVGGVWRGQWPVLWRYRWNMLRSNSIGTLIGALPGAGADIAAWITYALSRRFSKTPEKFGKGHVEGIVDASSANNASLGGAWVPAMVFGIPGDSITAIAIGVLYLKGLNPGPTLFVEKADQVYAIFTVFIVANLLMLPLGWLAIRSAKRLLAVPRGILMPVILVNCLVGAYAINNSLFDVWVVLAFGVLAFLMEENGFPVAPVILGIVLGPLVEENFIRSVIKADGALLAFFERPIAAVLGVATLAIWLVPPALRLARRLRRDARA